MELSLGGIGINRPSDLDPDRRKVINLVWAAGKPKPMVMKISHDDNEK